MNLRTYPALQKAACERKVLELVKDKGEITSDNLLNVATEFMTFKLAKDSVWNLLEKGKLSTQGDKLTMPTEKSLDIAIMSYDQVKYNEDGTVRLFTYDFSEYIDMPAEEWQNFLYKQLEGQ